MTTHHEMTVVVVLWIFVSGCSFRDATFGALSASNQSSARLFCCLVFLNEYRSVDNDATDPLLYL
jgi:hypothetical protein